jgi:hypothetical protein
MNMHFKKRVRPLEGKPIRTVWALSLFPRKIIYVILPQVNSAYLARETTNMKIYGILFATLVATVAATDFTCAKTETAVCCTKATDDAAACRSPLTMSWMQS